MLTVQICCLLNLEAELNLVRNTENRFRMAMLMLRGTEAKSLANSLSDLRMICFKIAKIFSTLKTFLNFFSLN